MSTECHQNCIPFQKEYMPTQFSSLLNKTEPTIAFHKIPYILKCEINQLYNVLLCSVVFLTNIVHPPGPKAIQVCDSIYNHFSIHSIIQYFRYLVPRQLQNSRCTSTNKQLLLVNQNIISQKSNIKVDELINSYIMLQWTITESKATAQRNALDGYNV